MTDSPTSKKTVTVMTAAKITELTTKYPGLGVDKFIHERDFDQAQQEIERLQRECSLALQNEGAMMRRLEDVLAQLTIVEKEREFAQARAMRAAHETTQGREEKLEFALRGLYWDNVDYLTLNKLGGMNNHWMRAAREALGMDPDDTRPTPTAPELRQDSPEIQFADVFKEVERGNAVNTQDLINALWWRVRNQRQELAKLHKLRNAEKSAETAEEHPAVAALRLILPLAKGYSRPYHSAQARQTQIEWIEAAERVLAGSTSVKSTESQYATERSTTDRLLMRAQKQLTRYSSEDPMAEEIASYFDAREHKHSPDCGCWELPVNGAGDE